MRSTWIAFLLCALVLTACAPAASAPAAATPTGTAGLVQISLPVGYIPNVQFAPLYVAIDKGYFLKEGIQLSLDYSTEIDAVSLVGAGKLQFAIASGDQVLPARQQGLPIVYVMAWYQQYPVGIASLKSQAVLKPQDLKGKKVGTPILSGASYIGLEALLSAGGLTDKDITLETTGFNQVEALATGRDQAVVVYVPNEPTQLKAQGYDVDVLRVADYMPLVSNGLVTNQATLEQNPDLVRRMIRATLQGLSDTLANPAEAYQISEKYVTGLAQADQKVQQQILATSIELWKADRLGYSDPKGWENMQKVMRSMGLLTQDQDLTQAYTNEFIP